MALPTFEELYVVSDLHLGGTRRVPIFNQELALGELFEWAAARKPEGGGRVGLLLNGDVIDTLAEDIVDYVASPAEAERVVADVDRRFPEVMKGLAKFVAEPNRLLVIVIGNHDLELAYPNVQEAILERLAGFDETKRGRIHFVTTGAGYRCRVGAPDCKYSTVLCVHGNEFDKWNAVSPENMTRIVRAAVLDVYSQRLKEHPNAGTKLVKDVMNQVKEEWPFVDLLKPEIDSVFNVLLALDWKQVRALGGVLAALKDAVTVGELRTKGLLGTSTGDATQPSAPPSWRVGRELSLLMDAPGSSGLSLKEAWEVAGQGIPAEDLLASGGTLGAGRALSNALSFAASRLRGVPTERALRAAFKDWGGGQETWELDGPCDVFDRLVKVEPRADALIAGHTHLRRQKRFPSERSEEQQTLYINTGTWARLLRLTEAQLASDQGFSGLWTALNAKSMKALDELGPDVLLNQPTVGVIRRAEDGSQVEGAVCEFRRGADPKQSVKPVSKFVHVRSG